MMLWIDQDCYYGPDRRRKAAVVRVRERRRYNSACEPPSLPVALRQLRMRVLDARGTGAAAFADRLQGVAIIAHMNGEDDASDSLSALAMTLARAGGTDVRGALYDGLDRAHAVLNTYH